MWSHVICDFEIGVCVKKWETREIKRVTKNLRETTLPPHVGVISAQQKNCPTLCLQLIQLTSAISSSVENSLSTVLTSITFSITSFSESPRFLAWFHSRRYKKWDEGKDERSEQKGESKTLEKTTIDYTTSLLPAQGSVSPPEGFWQSQGTQRWHCGIRYERVCVRNKWIHQR